MCGETDGEWWLVLEVRGRGDDAPDKLAGREGTGGASVRRNRARGPDATRDEAMVGLRVALPWLCADTRLWPESERCSDGTGLAASSSE